MVEEKLAMTAVLLAGGQSSRMKINKAFLKLGGRTLIEKNLEVLDSIFQDVIISANDKELYQQFGKPVITDVVMGQGPLGGLHASLSQATYDKVFFLACDMPFVEAKAIGYMAQKSKSFDIIIPALEGNLHPLHGFYSKRCLPQIEQHLKEGKRKLRDLFPHVSVYYVGRTELEEFGDVDRILVNVNTPDEWQALRNGS